MAAREIAAVLLVSACASAPAPAATAPAPPRRSGPTEVVASAVEYRRYDDATGVLALSVSASSAGASGDEASLEEVRFVRFSPEGAPALEANAERGRLLADGSVTFDGEVAVTWRGSGVVASFRAASARWDGKAGVLASDGPVSGRLRGNAGRTDDDAPRAAFGLDVEGRGLEVTPGGDRGRIERDVVAVATGVARGPWRATADAGLEFEGLARGRPVLRCAGPVGLEARGADARAEAVELRLRHDARGGVVVSRAFLVGTVCARLDDLAGPSPGGGPVEVRAEAAEVVPAGTGARATLLGTEKDPARVILPRGVVRGTRVGLSARGLCSDGGARSELEWGTGQ